MRCTDEPKSAPIRVDLTKRGERAVGKGARRVLNRQGVLILRINFLAEIWHVSKL